MEITINHKKFDLDARCSVEQMLFHVFPSGTRGMAVAVNQDIIFKSDWPLYHLKHGDDVMIIKATQGG